MTLAERVDSKANEAELLTAYANAKTGAGDVRLGDAVRTLVDGYGQGGGENQFSTTTLDNVPATFGDLVNAVIPKTETYHNYCIFLLSTSTNIVQNRIYGASIYKSGANAFAGAGLNYSYGMAGKTLSATTAVSASVGDVYGWLEIKRGP